MNSWCHEHMRWCLWAWLSIRWRVIPFQGSQWLRIQASKLQSSGLLITIVLILDDPHTPEKLHCQLDVLGEPYHCQSFFWQKKSFQKVSSTKKMPILLRKPPKHRPNMSPAMDPMSHEHKSDGFCELISISKVPANTLWYGKYIYGKYHIVHNLSKVYLNWIAIFHPAVE